MSAASVADFPRERSDLQGKCDSREQSESERTQRAMRIFPEREAISKENATAGAVSHHGLKSCGSRMGLSTICFANRDKSPTEASRSERRER